MYYVPIVVNKSKVIHYPISDDLNKTTKKSHLLLTGDFQKLIMNKIYASDFSDFLFDEDSFLSVNFIF